MIDEQGRHAGPHHHGLTSAVPLPNDHKFDPISTKDTTFPGRHLQKHQTMEVMKKPACGHEYPLATEADLARKADSDSASTAAKAEIAALIARETETLKKGRYGAAEASEAASRNQPKMS